MLVYGEPNVPQRFIYCPAISSYQQAGKTVGGDDSLGRAFGCHSTESAKSKSCLHDIVMTFILL